MTIDIKIKDFKLEDEIMENVINHIVDNISKEAQRLGAGRIDYEVAEEECPCMKEPSYNCGMKCSRCGREL